jgi:hypothetical protein
MKARKANPASIDENKPSPNNNCLAGKRCPNCGSYGPFEVVVSIRVLLYDTGADDAEDGSIEYDEDSPAICEACQYSGKFGDFHGKRGGRL